MSKSGHDKHESLNMLSDKAVMIWRIRATLILIIFSFLIGAIFVFWEMLSIILGCVGLAVYFLVVFIYCPMLYRMCGYTLEKGVVTISKGYFLHKYTRLPFSKIQYCMISQGPIQKMYGVCSVFFLTAGSSEAINDISEEEAHKIKASIEQ